MSTPAAKQGRRLAGDEVVNPSSRDNPTDSARWLSIRPALRIASGAGTSLGPRGTHPKATVGIR